MFKLPKYEHECYRNKSLSDGTKFSLQRKDSTSALLGVDSVGNVSGKHERLKIIEILTIVKTIAAQGKCEPESATERNLPIFEVHHKLRIRSLRGTKERIEMESGRRRQREAKGGEGAKRDQQRGKGTKLRGKSDNQRGKMNKQRGKTIEQRGKSNKQRDKIEAMILEAAATTEKHENQLKIE